ncbi:MAG: hypothetical protein N3A72_01745 [bacterium]|nr:hypothetical protein [bacterium]
MSCAESHNVGGNVQKSNRTYSGFIIGINEFRNNPKEVVRFVNELIKLDYAVYRCATTANISGIQFYQGEFIIDLNLTNKQTMVFRRLRTHHGIIGRFESTAFSIPAYKLVKGKIAVLDTDYSLGGADNHVNVLDNLGFSVEYVTDMDLLDGTLVYPEYLALVLPGLGGNSGSPWYTFGEKSKQVIRSFVQNGGGIFGTCAGAGLILSQGDFNDEFPNNYLDLAPIAGTVTFRGRGLILEKVLDTASPLFYGLDDEFYMFHNGGGGMRVLNDNAKPMAVYTNLARYAAKPWAHDYYHWDTVQNRYQGHPPANTEEEARDWLAPYLHNPNYASTVFATNGNGRLVATGDHPETLARLQEGEMPLYKDGPTIMVTREDINTGCMYEANIIYAITQSPISWIQFGLPRKVSDSNLTQIPREKFNSRLTQKNIARLKSELGIVEQEINELNEIITELNSQQANQTNVAVNKYLGKILSQTKKLGTEISYSLGTLLQLEVNLANEKTDILLKDLICAEQQLKSIKKELVFINNAVTQLHYIAKQIERTKGQYGSAYSADDRQEHWQTISEFLQLYISDSIPSNERIDYVFEAPVNPASANRIMALRYARDIVYRINRQIREMIFLKNYVQ